MDGLIHADVSCAHYKPGGVLGKRAGAASRRIDLAVQIPRPDYEARKGALRLYGSKLELPEATINSVAQKTDGTTASFTRELIRRAILSAAIAGVSVSAQHVEAAAAVLMDDSESLTRDFLGGTQDPDLGTDESTSEELWRPLAGHHCLKRGI